MNTITTPIDYANTPWEISKNGEVKYGGFTMEKNSRFVTNNYYLVFAPIQCKSKKSRSNFDYG